LGGENPKFFARKNVQAHIIINSILIQRYAKMRSTCWAGRIVWSEKKSIA
jgi:hypothetical protein